MDCVRWYVVALPLIGAVDALVGRMSERVRPAAGPMTGSTICGHSDLGPRCQCAVPPRPVVLPGSDIVVLGPLGADAGFLVIA
jgi:hypothetical protein